MAKMKQWVKLPTEWIGKKGLTSFVWNPLSGSDNIAALMVLFIIAHEADDDNGIAVITYNEFVKRTFLSRTKISAGLKVLEKNEIVKREGLGRSCFHLVCYGETPWGKFPKLSLYQAGEIRAFSDFHLRKRVELDALKLFFLIVERRDRRTNFAKMSYDKITELSGISRNHIKGALSLLAVQNLVHVEHLPSNMSEYGIVNAYRIPSIEPYNHMGTKGRGMDEMDFADKF